MVNPGLCSQGAKPVIQIAQQFIHCQPAALQVKALLRCANVAERAPRLTSCLLLAQAFAPQFVCFQLDVSFDFFSEVLRGALAPEHGYASSPSGP